MNRVLYYIVFALIFVCVFDPADRLFSLKIPLFILSLLLSLFISINQKKSLFVDNRLFLYFLIFSIILPFLSFFIYFTFFYNSVNFTGLSSLKTYFFLSFIFVLYIAKINIVNILNKILTILALAIIVFYYVVNSYSNVEHLNMIGKQYLIYSISYSVNWLTKEPYYRIYFWTSPLLIFSVTFSIYNALKFKSVKYYLLAFVNFYGMYLSGSRANQVMSIISIFAVFYLYIYFTNKNSKFILLSLTFFILPIIGYLLYPYLSILFSSQEHSNATKLSYVKDYVQLFHSDLKILLFGQGLGTDFYVSTLRQRMFFTELTYFELFRKFGLVMGAIYLLLLFYPISIFLTLKDKKNYSWLIISYLFYLIMSFFNPFLFSSSGIIILSIILVALITADKRYLLYFDGFKLI